MIVNFKPFPWRESKYWNVEYKEEHVVKLPFNIELIVRQDVSLKSRQWRWFMVTPYYTIEKGRCETMEGAQKRVEKMYKDYVTRGIEQVCE
jgi:hypothetical protein